MEKLNRNLNILQLSPFFSPNIGGVETHLDDLVKELANRKINSYVLTYQPVMSKINAPSIEKIGKYIFIRRLEIVRNLFLKIKKINSVEWHVAELFVSDLAPSGGLVEQWDCPVKLMGDPVKVARFFG